MRFITREACMTWCRDHGFPLDPAGAPVEPGPRGMPTVRFAADEVHPLHFFQHIAEWFEPSTEVLLWAPGTWGSMDHWSIYRRLRKGYGNSTHLHEEPGHLFATGEEEDLSSFLLLAHLASADAHVLGTQGDHLYRYRFGWLEFGSNDLAGLEAKREQLRDLEVPQYAARSA